MKLLAAICRELGAIGARLGILDRAVIKMGRSAADTAGSLEKLRASQHKIANGVANLADVPELLVAIERRLAGLETGCIDAINRVGGALYTTRAELGLPPLQPPPKEPAAPAEEP